MNGFLGFVKQLGVVLMAVATFLSSSLGIVFGGDVEDTQERYVAAVSAMTKYENTMETAKPQTELYNQIMNHFNAPLPEGKTEKKVVIIGYDGGRADAVDLIREESATARLLSGGGHAYLAYAGGVNFPAPVTQATSTAPGWCSILTGKLAAVTGITGNGIVKSNDNLTLMTTLLESKKADRTAFYTMWDGHFITDDSTYSLEKKYCEDMGLNAVWGKGLTDFSTFGSMLRELKRGDCADFMIGILEFPDASGHSTGFGPQNPIYKLGFECDEAFANLLIDAIEGRKDYAKEDWLIVITSDHGGFGTSHGGDSIQERYTFVVTNK